MGLPQGELQTERCSLQGAEGALPADRLRERVFLDRRAVREGETGDHVPGLIAHLRTQLALTRINVQPQAGIPPAAVREEVREQGPVVLARRAGNEPIPRDSGHAALAVP